MMYTLGSPQGSPYGSYGSHWSLSAMQSTIAVWLGKVVLFEYTSSLT